MWHCPGAGARPPIQTHHARLRRAHRGRLGSAARGVPAEPSSPDANRLRLVQVTGLQKLTARDRLA